MRSLAQVFDGWNGLNTSLVHSVESLTPEQLRWQPAEELRSVGELTRHISLARLGWFSRMQAPGSAKLLKEVSEWETDHDGNQHIVEEAFHIQENAGELVNWLNKTWGMIEQTLNSWDVDDLSQSYPYTFMGTAYNNTRQWTIYRILTHDHHHGGQLSLMLGMQGIQNFELGDLFGHLTMPPEAG